jgi:RimJ/RimL family protein N-acetyltransferase
MSCLIEPFTLTGVHVRLEPLAAHHAPGLAAAAAGDRSTFGFTAVPDGVEEARRYIDQLLGDRDRGLVVPFAQRRLDNGELAGCTRYMELRRWRGRVEPDEVEIGGTWLAAGAQRTAVNTEAKLLLLRHAFESWGVWRVAICTDVRNARSRDAIERLGATFEGVLRSHRLVNQPGEIRPRDTAVYSIVSDEWPAVRERLVARLDRTRAATGRARRSATPPTTGSTSPPRRD